MFHKPNWLESKWKVNAFVATSPWPERDRTYRYTAKLDQTGIDIELTDDPTIGQLGFINSGTSGTITLRILIFHLKEQGRN